jgi:hypothetical protein
MVVAPLASEYRVVGPLVTAVGPPVLGWYGNPGGSQGTSSGAGMGATLQELSCRKMSKSLVRRDKIAKGKSISSKTICQKTMMLLIERSRH